MCFKVQAPHSPHSTLLPAQIGTQPHRWSLGRSLYQCWGNVLASHIMSLADKRRTRQCRSIMYQVSVFPIVRIHVSTMFHQIFDQVRMTITCSCHQCSTYSLLMQATRNMSRGHANSLFLVVGLLVEASRTVMAYVDRRVDNREFHHVQVSRFRCCQKCAHGSLITQPENKQRRVRACPQPNNSSAQ